MVKSNLSTILRNEKYIVVILGGDVPCGSDIGDIINNSAYCVCADSGTVVADKFGRLPDYLVGDMDSIPAELLQKCQNSGVPQKRFMPEKDYTDGEIAVHYAIEYAKKNSMNMICMVGALGNRFDHSLANINIGTQVLDNGLKIIYCTDTAFMFLLKGNSWHKVELINGRTISLLPLFGDVHGVTLQGFKYPLTNAALLANESLGISNELTTDEGQITLEKGYLLVVQNRFMD